MTTAAQLPTSSSSSSSSSSSVASLDIALIHRVLLTEPSEFSNLTLSGQPRNTHTPSLDEFSQDLNDNIHPLHAIKRAFRDYLVDQLSRQPPQAHTHNDEHNDHVDDTVAMGIRTNRMQPLQSLVLELHQNVRSLVPNRADLHSLLSDDDIQTATTLKDIMALLIRAAQGLQQLESEARSESTAEWIVLAQQQSSQPQHDDVNDMNDVDMSKFVVTSLLYLLYKCELCQADKDDFYLSQVWAPKIHHGAEGVSVHRKAFFQQYGRDVSDPNMAPRTRQWIQTLVSKAMHAPEDGATTTATTTATTAATTIIITPPSLDTAAAKRDLIRTGWIQDVLFRSTESSALNVPEILALDVDRLQAIRQLTRQAAAGSALTLLISHITGTDTSTTPAAPFTTLATRQHGLMKALQTTTTTKVMSSLSSSPSMETYEASVVQQVIALAIECKPNLETTHQEALHHRALAVLRGQDPVLNVLDQRMKHIFGQLVHITLPEVVVPVVRSGQNPTTSKTATATAQLELVGNYQWDTFLVQARQLFTQRGLALYANQLAVAAKLAKKIIDLAWILYEDVLSEMIRQACEHEAVGTEATTS